MGNGATVQDWYDVIFIVLMNQIKAGVILNYVVIGLNTLVGLLYTPYMLRMMGQSEYGLYSLVASVIAYMTIMDFGFGNAIIRYTAKFRAEGKVEEQYSMFGMFAVIYSLIGLLVLVGGAVLCFNIENLFGDTMTIEEMSRAKIIMAIMTFNLAISFPMGIYGSIITAYEDFIFQKSLNIIRIILNTVVMICLLHFGYKAVAMVVVQTVFNVLTFVANYIYCKRKISVRFTFGKFQWGFLREIAIYSFWIFLNAIMDRIYWSTGPFVLGVVSGTAAVAIFALAISFEHMYMSFSTAIMGVFLPRVSGMIARQASDREVSDLFIRTGRIQYAVIVFALSLFIVFGRQFITLWAGDGYSEVYIITLMFFVALMVPLAQNMGITILQARNQMEFRSLLYIVIATVSIIGQIILGQRFGAVGCALSVSLALLIGQGIVMNIYYKVKQRIDIVSFWKEVGKMSIVPILMVLLGLWLLSRYEILGIYELILGVLIFAILYLPAFWCCGLSTVERDMIKTIFVRRYKRHSC